MRLAASLLLALALAAIAPAVAALPAPDTAAADTTAAPAFTVYYFHGHFRCENCLRIEEWTRKTVHAEFARELESGWLQWQVINAQEDANAHFAAKYQLAGQAVILAAWENGEVTRWQNLEEVWDLLASEDAFHDYIVREVLAFEQPPE